MNYLHHKQYVQNKDIILIIQGNLELYETNNVSLFNIFSIHYRFTWNVFKRLMGFLHEGQFKMLFL